MVFLLPNIHATIEDDFLFFWSPSLSFSGISPQTMSPPPFFWILPYLYLWGQWVCNDKKLSLLHGSYHLDKNNRGNFLKLMSWIEAYAWMGDFPKALYLLGRTTLTNFPLHNFLIERDAVGGWIFLNMTISVKDFFFWERLVLRIWLGLWITI